MKTRVIVSLAAATAANATTIRNVIDGALAGKPRFEDLRDAADGPPVITTDLEGVRRVVMSFRFESPADAVAFFALARTEFNRTRVRPGSQISMHNCTHDDQESAWIPCDSVQAAYQEFVK